MSDRSRLINEALAKPNWEHRSTVHNWRNYVGSYTRGIWHTLSDDQKIALAKDADKLASNEEWD